ncbi:MAG TPA: ATP-binding protein [Candidatus Binataceae bacterium]|nr:ATP-binding protein [Candidatus Binataceae bacterium]
MSVATSARGHNASSPPVIAAGFGARGHRVQFYEDESFLVKAVARLIGDGLGGGDAGVIIATAPHLREIENLLIAGVPDLDALRKGGQYVALDAVDVLSEFMAGEMPDQTRFKSSVGEVIRRAALASPRGYVRAYGEMVSVLWSEGKRDATLALEDLWNDILRAHQVSLCCGYSLNDFSADTDGEVLLKVCAKHALVAPAESYTELATEQERLNSIIHLQQQAKALEVESAGRKQAERALNLRERELTDFLENAAEGLHRVGADGRIVWANAVQLRMLGYSAEEYVGSPLATLFERPEVFEEFWRRLTQGEVVYDFPAALRCKDGAVKQVLIHSSILWEEGKFIYTRCFIRDVSDRVRLEGELERRHAELAQADRQRNEFLAMLGHELRNPLSAVLNALTTARRNEAGAEPSVEIAWRQAGQLARLVDDLLDIGRITQGRISLRKKPVLLGRIVEQAADDARFLVQARRHDLMLSIEPDIRVEADPARLCQVVFNLIDNAAKYTAPGGRIDVTVRSTGQEAIVCVRDTGVGIAGDMLPHVFDLFAQAESTLDRSYSGLGLGLTLVKRLVEMHDGRVAVRSDGIGRGAEFELSLPMLPSSNSNAQALAELAPQASQAARVLIVEDNPDVCETLVMLLESFGHSAEAVEDGLSAIKSVDAGVYDAMLVDIGLPGLDGYEVARRIRALPHTESMILIALTGYGRDEDRRRALSAGFNHHLTKPVDVDRLQSILARKQK